MRSYARTKRTLSEEERIENYRRIDHISLERNEGRYATYIRLYIILT